jgi:hypothetical protein
MREKNLLYNVKQKIGDIAFNIIFSTITKEYKTTT